MGMDGLEAPEKDVRCRQAHCTSPAVATQAAPVNACLALSHAQPAALSACMSAQPLPDSTSMGAALMLALQRTAGKSNGRAGLGYTSRSASAAEPQSSTVTLQLAESTSGPLTVQERTMPASLAVVKPSTHVTVCPAGRGLGSVTHPTAL
jgi:hypothetical protein